MTAKIRGSTQILDLSIPLTKLDGDLQEMVSRQEVRVNFVATEGQTVLADSNFQPGVLLKVLLNGMLLQPGEYTLNAGNVALTVPMVAGDQASVFYGNTIPAIQSLQTDALTINYTGEWLVPPVFQMIPGSALRIGGMQSEVTGKVAFDCYISEGNLPNGPRLTSLEFIDLKATISTCGVANMTALTSFSLPELAVAKGAFMASVLPALTTLNLPELEYIGSNFSVSSLASLVNVNVSKLKSTGGNFTPASIPLLPALNLPELKTVAGNFNPSALTSLSSMELPKLENLGGNFNPSTLSALTTLNLPALATVGGSFSPASMAALTTLNLPALETAGGGFTLTSGTAALADISLGSTLKTVGGNVNFTSCALSQASVDHILVRLAALDGTNGTTAFASPRTVTLTGTSAVPSQTGLDAKAILVARGVTVTHK